MKTIEINCRRERLKLLQNLNNEVTCRTDTDDFYRSISVVILSLFVFLTVIDNFFFDPTNSNVISGNLTCNISDHFPQFLMVKNIFPDKKTKHNIQKHNWSKFDKNELILDFFDTNWDNCLQIEKRDIDHSFKIFFTKINNLLNRYAPLQKLSRKEVKLLNKPWITKGIQISMFKRDKLHKLFRNSKNPVKKLEYELQFKKYRNMIVALTRKSKKIYFSSFFQSNILNLRKVWQGINSIISNKSKKYGVSSIYLNNNDITSDPILISNNFNDYFSKVATNTRSKNRAFFKAFL